MGCAAAQQQQQEEEGEGSIFGSMKHLLVVVLFVATSSSVFAQAADSLDAKIARLLELSGAEAQFLGAVDNMLAMQRQQATYSSVPAEFWDEFSEEIHTEGWQLILPDLVEVYRNNMTEEEIDYQIAYFDTPLGQQIVGKTGVIMQQSMAAGQQWGVTMANKVGARLQEAMEKE